MIIEIIQYIVGNKRTIAPYLWYQFNILIRLT